MPKIHFETYGSGETQLVICNGLSQSTANWRGLARQNPQFRWILFDARGHGKSEVGPIGDRPYQLDDHVTDLLEVLEQSQAKKPILLGFSHGARVALRAAATHGPDFSGLIVVSCISQITPRRKAHVESWARCLEIGGVEAMAWASLPNIVGPKILENFPDLSLLVKGTVARNNKEGLQAMFEGMLGYHQVVQDAVVIDLPTVVLRGTADPLVEARDQDELCGWIKNAVPITFRDCGHTLPLEEPAAFIKVIEDLAKG